MIDRFRRAALGLTILATNPGIIAAQTPAAMPDKAEITYRGTYVLQAVPKMQRRGSSSQVDRLEGALIIEAVIDGPAVTARFKPTGGLNPATFSGVYSDGRCRMTDAGKTIVYEGECSASGFSGMISDTPNSSAGLSGQFNLSTTNFVDVAVRDAKAAEDRKAREAKRAALKAQCDAGKLTACVEMDQLD